MRIVGAVVLSGLVAVTAASQGCNRPRAADAQSATVDSALPREETLRRFREGIPTLDSLAGGAPTRDALVQRFFTALERHDTASLAALALTRAEFAWVYYPTTSQGLPPYDLSPGLLWFMLDERGRAGQAQLLAERAGSARRAAGYRCDAAPAIEGENRVHLQCLVLRVQAPGDTVRERLFGPILEHRGRFKFVNLSNAL